MTHNHTPDRLPPLVVDLGADMYGLESTFVQKQKPATAELAVRAFEICKLGVRRNSSRIENAYPAHIGGVDRLAILQTLAEQHNVELAFPLAKKL